MPETRTIAELVLERASFLLMSRVTGPEEGAGARFDIEEAARKVLAEITEPEVVVLASELHVPVLPEHEREGRKLEGWLGAIADGLAECFILHNPNCLTSLEQRTARREAALAAKQKPESILPDVIEGIRERLAEERSWEKHTMDQVGKAVEGYLADLTPDRLARLAGEYKITASSDSLKTRAARKALASFFVYDVQAEYVFVYDQYITD